MTAIGSHSHGRLRGRGRRNPESQATGSPAARRRRHTVHAYGSRNSAGNGIIRGWASSPSTRNSPNSVAPARSGALM